jgi:hypothetical protein
MVVYIRQPMNYIGIYYNSTVNNLHDLVTLIKHLFVTTKTKFEDKGRIKSGYICGDKSYISLILQIYKIHNSWTCLPHLLH